MKAATFFRYGAPDVLSISDVDKPEPDKNEILIRVNASSVTTGDMHLRQADPWAARLFSGLFKPKLNILGSELAGVVDAVGEEVSQFTPGDRVFGATGLKLGANAEYLCLPESGPVTQTPDQLTDEEAASIPFGAVTALYFLRDRAQLKSGQKVLVYGASGAVGIYAVQLAACMGAKVTALCSTRNIDKVIEMGATHTIDYTGEEFTRSPHAPWDVIIDTVGVTSFKQCRPVLSNNGVYLPVAGGLREFIQALTTSIAAMSGFNRQRVKAGMAVENQSAIEFLAERVVAGHIRPVIDRCYPLDDIVAAHQYVDTGRKAGAVVLSHR